MGITCGTSVIIKKKNIFPLLQCQNFWWIFFGGSMSVFEALVVYYGMDFFLTFTLNVSDV